jgi:hypothetical protein
LRFEVSCARELLEVLMSGTINYSRVYDAVELDSTLREVASGRVRVPLMRVRTPFASYGFPPALIPLWSDGSAMTYVGLWKHWFAPRRATFVECHLEEDCRVYEIARSPAQLLHVLGLEILCVNEGDRGELEDFAGRCGGGIDIDALERVAWRSGDDPSGLLELPMFRHDPPLSMCGDHRAEYRGDFPNPNVESEPARLQTSCTLEVPESFLQMTRADADRSDYPPWYRTTEIQPLFAELLASDNHTGAWLSLNSHGWNYADAKQALATLSRTTSDASLRILADAWASLDHGASGGY